MAGGVERRQGGRKARHRLQVGSGRRQAPRGGGRVIPARPERRVISDIRQQSVHVGRLELLYLHSRYKKGFPYSLPSVGPGADPGVQAVSPQVT